MFLDDFKEVHQKKLTVHVKNKKVLTKILEQQQFMTMLSDLITSNGHYSLTIANGKKILPPN